MTGELFTLAQGKQTDKGTLHAAYLPVYERLFAPHRDRLAPVLEVGVQYGGSLLLWRDYFSCAPVIGVDVAEVPQLSREGITVLRGDAYVETSVEFIGRYGPFAVLIDDGPHTVESQRFFVERYSQHLAQDGVLIVEDVQLLSSANELAAAAPVGFVGEVVDLRRLVYQADGTAPGAADDILVVVKRVAT